MIFRNRKCAIRANCGWSLQPIYPLLIHVARQADRWQEFGIVAPTAVLTEEVNRSHMIATLKIQLKHTEYPQALTIIIGRINNDDKQ